MAARTSGSEGVRAEGADVKNLSKFSPFLPPCENGTHTQKSVGLNLYLLNIKQTEGMLLMIV